MKIGEFDVMIFTPWDDRELSAEIRKGNQEVAEVSIKDGQPIIEFSPNHKNEQGVWTIDYRTLKQIIKALDDFLVSLGYSPEIEGEQGAQPFSLVSFFLGNDKKKGRGGCLVTQTSSSTPVVSHSMCKCLAR